MIIFVIFRKSCSWVLVIALVLCCYCCEWPL